MMTKLLLAVPLALALAACGFNQKPSERALAKADSLLDDLNATADQKTAVKGAMTGLFKIADDDRAVRVANRDALKAELAKDKPDVTVVQDRATASVASFAKTAHAFVDAGGTIHDALTKEQRAALDAKMKPGRPMKAAMFMAERFGFGPPLDAADAKARAEKHLDKALAAIDATDAQTKALRPLALGLVDEASPLLGDREAVTDAFQTAWKSDKPDLKALHALIDDEAKKLDAVARDAAARAVTANALLTPDQRAQIAARFAASEQHAAEHAGSP